MATNLSAALLPYHHHHSDATHHRPLHLTTPYFLPHANKRLTTVHCSSKKAAPPPPPTVGGEQNSPSLAEQLKPLSTTVLSDGPNETNLLSNPKSTWVNPTKPKPSVLSLQRHKRSSSYTNNPQFKDLRQFSSKLNECDESDFLSVLEGIPHPPTRENALLVLNSLRSWQKSLIFLNWVKAQNVFPMETIFYNVTMKSLRLGKQFQHTEDLALEMIEKGIELDNITYSTIITCAKKCNLFDKAADWFEQMYKTGLKPDEVTYSAILDVYAKLGKVGEVLSLYERARASGWKPDPFAFSVLAKMFGETGDYDGINSVLQEIKSLGVKPNLVLYNTLLEALGKAGKPGLARSLFEEMLGLGIEPNEKTLTILIKIYGRARWGRDAVKLWERMRTNGWPVDFILYNSLLSMCADLGLVDEGEKLFDEMKKAKGKRKPDSWSYTAMMSIYGSAGDVSKAMALFQEMSDMGLQLNVMGCTSLMRCLGKSKKIDDLVRVFNTSVENGVRPDDRLCGCLLSVLSNCEGDDDDDANKVLSCLERANPKLFAFVNLLCGGEDESVNVGLDKLKDEFKSVLSGTDVEARRPFCNCLIDICRKRNLHRRAHELLYLGTVYGLYQGLHTKTEEEWRLNVRSLSVGAAETAFEEWMGTLVKIVQRKESLPALFSASTGAGTHKFSHGLGRAFASHVEKMAAPFHESEGKSGLFVATREDLVLWVESKAFTS
ncbi:pentatricopeptide repeat-containing protein [Striga asiatica]|uniref:Pentatricopeptide repeat-containing protein n=1 Tax=Striga asiatica TaxID=4170 RepID=A0A5A7QGV4_STRAF|nr:pentatricopeptide repeat-containing protein [Striga asiatica]